MVASCLLVCLYAERLPSAPDLLGEIDSSGVSRSLCSNSLIQAGPLARSADGGGSRSVFGTPRPRNGRESCLAFLAGRSAWEASAVYGRQYVE